ncbi:transmembrane protein, putative [Medicago truncatula]|uniref:Transmembrane protein, putative n=1 Tax=Medicago truncatula TaxID=3880 RepID=G7ICX0_MEDTR|nr:transmembrane protein, putative [Medicago truncatula]
MIIVYDDILKACFSKHSQWPPKSFRLRQWPPKNFRLSPGLRVNAAISFLGCLRSNYSLVILLIGCLIAFAFARLES